MYSGAVAFCCGMNAGMPGGRPYGSGGMAGVYMFAGCCGCVW